MEKYDVIIIGAGIAGTGLAYNLQREGYKGSVLVIDKKEPGANALIYRNTFKEIVNDYSLKYIHKYDGVKISSFKKEILTLKKDFYSIDYKKTCKDLLKRSLNEFRKEEAIDLRKGILKTDNTVYKFNFLIDCSGSDFFIRKLFNLNLPSRYWIGYISTIKNNNEFKDNYFYYSTNSQGFLEDIYPFKNIIMKGSWRYVNKIDFNLLNDKKEISKTIPYLESYENKKAIIPCSLALPLMYKNYTFLGDSFGNATPSAGEGIRPILDSSKLLAYAIKKGNLKLYEKEWEKRYLKSYIKHLSLKSNFKDRIKILELLTNYPDIIYKLLRNEDIEIPKEIKRNISRKIITKQIYYYINFKIKYFLQEIF